MRISISAVDGDDEEVIEFGVGVLLRAIFGTRPRGFPFMQYTGIVRIHSLQCGLEGGLVSGGSKFIITFPIILNEGVTVPRNADELRKAGGVEHTMAVPKGMSLGTLHAIVVAKLSNLLCAATQGRWCAVLHDQARLPGGGEAEYSDCSCSP